MWENFMFWVSQASVDLQNCESDFPQIFICTFCNLLSPVHRVSSPIYLNAQCTSILMINIAYFAYYICLMGVCLEGVRMITDYTFCNSLQYSLNREPFCSKREYRPFTVFGGRERGMNSSCTYDHLAVATCTLADITLFTGIPIQYQVWACAYCMDTHTHTHTHTYTCIHALYSPLVLHRP